MKGLVIELASLAAFSFGVWGGIHFSSFVSSLMHDKLNITFKYLSVVAFCITFLGIIIGVYAFGKFVDSTVKAISLSIVNKLAGAAFGAIKFGLILSVLFFLLNAAEKNVPIIPSEIKAHSLLYEPIRTIAPTIFIGLKEIKLNSK